jgi:hypothetical protein
MVDCPGNSVLAAMLATVLHKVPEKVDRVVFTDKTAKRAADLLFPNWRFKFSLEPVTTRTLRTTSS